MTQQCQGGWCRIRNACHHYTAPASADEPADRLCDPGHDGRIDGEPLRAIRAGANRTSISDSSKPVSRPYAVLIA